MLRNISKRLGPGLILQHDLDSADSGWGPVAGFCKPGNEPLGPIKKGGFCLKGE
jgi:hypothetical protein